MIDAAWVIAAACLLTSALVDLRVVHGALDVPVADLLAMGLAGAWGLYSVRRVGPRRAFGALEDEGSPAPLALPAWPWWGLFLAVCLASAAVNGFGFDTVYAIVRNPLFAWLVYGVGVAGVVRDVLSPERIRWTAAVHVVVASGLVLPPSLWLLRDGHAAAWMDVPGLINNHKVLAVAIAPWLGALLRWRPLVSPRFVAFLDVAIALGGFAVAASFSKTAWICAALGLVAYVSPRGTPLVARPLALALVALIAVGAMSVLPSVAGLLDMNDAFDSRMSLNLRAWRMWSSAPLLGWGPGMSVRWLMNDAPHWRIDHVDAHGVVQKMVGEVGAVGLVAYGAAYAWFVLRFFRATRPDAGRFAQGAALLGLGLQFELLLSTDVYSSTCWAPLAVALGVVSRPQERGGPSQP